MFDINKAIKNSGLSKAGAARLQKEIKKDYPHDSMLYELHVIRALRIREKSSQKSARVIRQNEYIRKNLRPVALTA